MAEDARTTGKRMQVTVLGGLALVVAAITAVVLSIVETPTITYTAGLLGLGFLLIIAYLLVKL